MATKNAYQILSEKMKSQDFHKRINAYSSFLDKDDEDEEKKRRKNVYQHLSESMMSQNYHTGMDPMAPAHTGDKEASARIAAYNKLKAQVAADEQTARAKVYTEIMRKEAEQKELDALRAEQESRRNERIKLQQITETPYRLKAPNSGEYLKNNMPTTPDNPLTRQDNYHIVTPIKNVISGIADDIQSAKYPTAFNKTPIRTNEPYTAPVKPSIGERLNTIATGITEGNMNALNIIGETAATAAGARPLTKAEQQMEQQSLVLQRQINELQQKNPRATYTTNTELKRLIDERDRIRREYNKSVRTVQADSPATVEANRINANMEKALAGLNSDQRNFAEALISVGQNASLLPLAAVNPTLPLVGMGAVSAAGRMNELNQQGVSADQAFIRGTIAGVIEGITEKLPLDNFIDIVKAGGKTTLVGILKQAGMEATEEAVAYAANYIADKAANDKTANFNVQEFMKAAQAGLISGGIMGTGGTIVNRISNIKPKTIDQVIPEITTNPAKAAQDPATAATIIDPAQTKTILAAMQEAYGKDVNGNVTPETKQRAFEATKNLLKAAKQTVTTANAALASAREAQANAAGVDTAPVERSAESVKTAKEYIQRSEMSDELKKAYSAVVNNSRYNIRFDDTLNPETGGYNNGTEVVINPKSEQGIDYLITHEIGHYGENDEMINFALQSLKDVGYISGDGSIIPVTDDMIQTAFDSVRTEYAEQGIKLDDAGVRAETAMKYYGDLLSADAKTIQRLAQEKPTFVQRIIEAIDDLITRIKGTAQEKRLVDIRKRFVEAVRSGAEQAQTRYAFKGYDTDGRGIYESNFPKGTPKAAKSQRILSLVQNVWSKNPINLVIEDGTQKRTIQAQFDPTYSETEKTDVTKLMFGNRHGNASEQRVTLDLADDYYQIAQEAKHNYTKSEDGKSSKTHEGVKQWHYFINDIQFTEQGQDTKTPFRVTVNVKERNDGNYVYSFSAERQNKNERPADVHSEVSGNAADVRNNSIPTSDSNVNKKFSTGSSLQQLLEKPSGQVDSTGKKLTQAQAEFFKDSKARDDKGKLLELYHGTANDFTVFGNKGAKTGVPSAQKGYWFSDSTDTAEAYSRPQQEAFKNSDEYYKFVEQSNSISAPIIQAIFNDPYQSSYPNRERAFQNGFFNPQALKEYTQKYDRILHEIFNNLGVYDINFDTRNYYALPIEQRQRVAKLQDKMLEAYQERYLRGRKYTSKIAQDFEGRIRAQVDIALAKKYGINPHTETVYLNIKNPLIARGAYYADKDKTARLNRALREGKDGVIFKDVLDGGELSTHYVVFSPEQIKRTNNQNPTYDPDIRFSTGSNLGDIFQTYDTKPTPDPAQSMPDRAEPTAQDAAVARAAKAVVLNRSPQDKVTFKQKAVRTAKAAYREIFDTGAAISDIAKIVQDNILYPAYNNAKQGRQAGEYMISGAQLNAAGQRVGDSLVDIVVPVMDKGDDYYTAFQTYLYNWHHIDRMAQEKPVFGEQWTVEDAKREIAELTELHPEFAEIAQKVWKYNDNLLQFRVDTGLISAEQAKEMREKYPHYVPTFRDMTSSKGTLKAFPVATVNTGIKKATGSDRPLLPLHENMARQTMQVVQAGKSNVFGNRLLAQALTYRDTIGDYIQEALPTADGLDIDADIQALPQLKNAFNIYVNGKPIQIKISREVYAAIEPLTGTNDVFNQEAWEMLRKANQVYKQLITSLSPMFTVRNFVRDAQDVLLYSKDLGAWAKAVPEAFNQIKKNGDLWQLYQGMGGYGSSFFDYQKGIKIEKLTRKGFKKAVAGFANGVETLNYTVEQFPRFTEFVATIKKGGRSYENILRAMYNAADVTVNFGRSGKFGKKINSTLVPFFNPAVQGFDKMVRTFTQQPSARAFTILALRAAVWGITPSVLNSLLVDLFGDDEVKESYADLRDRDKDINYLLYVGDGQWFKLPKGRVVSVFGSAAQRAMRVPEEGWKNAWAGYLKTVKEQVAPQNPFSSHFFSPLAGVSTNRTWWGGVIEPERVQNLPAGQRYDETTDYFSKWLGGILGYSPKKINYLLDSYTGIIGDILLPLATPRAEQNPFISAFVLDGKVSNRISNDFYQRRTDMTEASNSAESSAKSKAVKSVALRHYNKVQESVSELQKEIRAIETDTTMKDSDKRIEVRELKATIAGIQKKALSDIDKYEAAVKKHLTGTEDADKDHAYLYANRDVFGAEYAIRTYNKKTYEKAYAASQQGIPYSKYFDLFLASSPDADDNGSVTQEEMQAMLDKSGLTKKQKAFLWEQQNKSWKNNPYK